jgi:hypothetical protein
MEVARFFETLVQVYQATMCHILEETNHHFLWDSGMSYDSDTRVG